MYCNIQKYTETLCKELAERFRDQNVELVIGPMTGGILLAHEVGKALGTRAIFTEREKGVMTLRRGFKIEPGTRVLIVEDIVTTGGSVQEVVNVVNQSGGEIVGVGLLVNRSGGKADLVYLKKSTSLTNLEVPTYKQDECPLCKDGVAIQNAVLNILNKIINKYKKSSFTEELFLFVCSYCV